MFSFSTLSSLAMQVAPLGPQSVGTLPRQNQTRIREAGWGLRLVSTLPRVRVG